MTLTAPSYRHGVSTWLVIINHVWVKFSIHCWAHVLQPTPGSNQWRNSLWKIFLSFPKLIRRCFSFTFSFLICLEDIAVVCKVGLGSILVSRVVTSIFFLEFLVCRYELCPVFVPIKLGKRVVVRTEIGSRLHFLNNKFRLRIMNKTGYLLLFERYACYMDDQSYINMFKRNSALNDFELIQYSWGLFTTFFFQLSSFVWWCKAQGYTARARRLTKKSHMSRSIILFTSVGVK